MIRRVQLVAGLVAALATAAPVLAPAPADARSPRAEYWEGRREIARERREMRRDILQSQSPAEARRAYREGMREIARERREMRREIRRSVNRRFVGRIVAGVVLGSVIRAVAVGRAPPRPSPDLCWTWNDARRESGYWYYCDER